MQRADGTKYDGFYDRQLIVSVTSDNTGGGASTSIAEDKQIIPDDNVLQYTVTPLDGDRLLRINVRRTLERNCLGRYLA